MNDDTGPAAQAGRFSAFDTARMSGTHWRWAVLTVLAHYFDAGAIVAGAVSLSVWASAYGMSDSTLGLVAALGPNAIGCGVGALIGGWLGDKLGRKRVFSIDLLVFAAGMLLIVVAPNATLIIVGYMLAGLAVGVDIPTSESLLAEFTPVAGRGKVFGLSVASWLAGPIVASALAALLMEPLGIWASRIIFAHLAVVAVVVWWLRRRFPESPRWLALHGRHDEVREAAKTLGLDPDTVVGTDSEHAPVRTRLRDLLDRRILGKLAFTVPVYVIWGIPAGTYGMFLPYLIENAGKQSPLLANSVNVLNFTLGVVGAILFILIGDRISRKLLWSVGAALHALAFFAFLFVPVTNLAMILINVVIVATTGGLCATPIIRLWSIEPFPTQVRGTMQSLSFGAMRIFLGFWSLWVLGIVSAAGFDTLAVFLGATWVVLLVLGVLFGPNTTGRSIDELEETSLRQPGAAARTT